MKISDSQYALALLGEIESKSEEQIVVVIENFVKLLADNNDLKQWPSIEKIFLTEVDKQNGVLEVEIKSAYQLDNETKKRFAEIIHADTSCREIVWREIIKPQMIGGAILRYGNKVIDLSLNSATKNLAKKLAA